jgi:hypothetical protein
MSKKVKNCRRSGLPRGYAKTIVQRLAEKKINVALHQVYAVICEKQDHPDIMIEITNLRIELAEKGKKLKQLQEQLEAYS